ncbi:MAG: hypothetical protein WA234_03625 [Rectinemataceae bacterium]
MEDILKTLLEQEATLQFAAFDEGTVAVSGLPQDEDHRLMTECIAVILGLR